MRKLTLLLCLFIGCAKYHPGDEVELINGARVKIVELDTYGQYDVIWVDANGIIQTRSYPPAAIKCKVTYAEKEER